MPLVSGEILVDIKALDSAATQLENKMVQLKHTGKGQDVIRLPGMIMEKLSYLAMTVAIADFKPVDQYVEVFDKLHTEWLEVKKNWELMKNQDVTSLRNTMKENQVGPLIIGED